MSLNMHFLDRSPFQSLDDATKKALEPTDICTPSKGGVISQRPDLTAH